MGRKSAVNKLPQKPRERARELLADEGNSLGDVKEKLGSEFPDAPPIGETSLHREREKMKRWDERRRQSEAVVQAWLQNGGANTDTEMGKLLQATLRMLAFQATDAMSAAAEGEGIDIKAFGILSRSFLAIENGARISAERERELIAQGERDALKKLDKAGKAVGLTADMAKQLRLQLGGAAAA